jgi:uncharacterized protein (TIGR03067 family)
MAAAVGLFAGADEPKAADTKKEVERLQGTWTIGSVVINGEEVPAEVGSMAKLVVEGDHYTVTLGEQSVPSTFKLDPSKAPKTIDFTYTDGPQKDQTVKGIYKLEDDIFTMCRSLTAEGKRPTEFAAPATSGLVLVVWKHAKPSASAKEAAIREELARFQGTWQLVSAESNGEKAPEERVRQIRVTITGSTHTVRFGDEVIVHDVGFEIDPSKTPKEVTDTINDGPDKGKQILGIYKLDGDSLTSCTASVGKERPTEFASTPGSGHTLRVFRRSKQDDAKPEAK